jgi:hypothetical protein
MFMLILAAALVVVTVVFMGVVSSLPLLFSSGKKNIIAFDFN